jgi:ferritin-like metal-binding protein YciE
MLILRYEITIRTLKFKHMQKTKKAPAAPRKKMTSQQKEDLSKVFEDGLKDMYWAEKYLVKALPKMAKASEDEELAGAFEDHLAQTEEHVAKLEQVFELIGKKAVAKKCDAMEGLGKEAESVMEEHEAGPARDAALIMAAQKVEHYEIASYGSLATFAKVLGNTEARDILGAILDNEKDADSLLSEIAESINETAAE